MIHLVCPVKVFPICVPVTGSQRQIYRNSTTKNKYCISRSWVTHYNYRADVFVGSLLDCSCTLKPVFCRQVTRRCSAPSVCVLKSGRIQLQWCLKALISDLYCNAQPQNCFHTSGSVMRCLSCQVPKTHCGIT